MERRLRHLCSVRVLGIWLIALFQISATCLCAHGTFEENRANHHSQISDCCPEGEEESSCCCALDGLEDQARAGQTETLSKPQLITIGFEFRSIPHAPLPSHQRLPVSPHIVQSPILII